MSLSPAILVANPQEFFYYILPFTPVEKIVTPWRD
jgi:hypothetical protein